MNAGKELDALVAEKVMGPDAADYIHTLIGVFRDTKHYPHPAYSTDIKAAWLVAEKLKAKGFQIGLDEGGADRAACVVARLEDGITTILAEGIADAAAEAICLAALNVVGA